MTSILHRSPIALGHTYWKVQAPITRSVVKKNSQVNSLPKGMRTPDLAPRHPLRENAYVFQAQEHKKWDCGHSSLDPFLQRNSPIMIIVNLFHHFMKDLKQRRRKPCNKSVKYISDATTKNYIGLVVNCDKQRSRELK